MNSAFASKSSGVAMTTNSNTLSEPSSKYDHCLKERMAFVAAIPLLAMSSLRKTRSPPRSFTYCSKSFAGSTALVAAFSKTVDVLKQVVLPTLPFPQRFFAPCPTAVATPAKMAAEPTPAPTFWFRVSGVELGGVSGKTLEGVTLCEATCPACEA